MKRFPAFPRHFGPRNMVHAATYQSPEGRIGIRVSVPSGSGQMTTVELPVGAARDAMSAIGAALADARAALDLICSGEPENTHGRHERPEDGAFPPQPETSK